jgi:hypothetical protein
MSTDTPERKPSKAERLYHEYGGCGCQNPNGSPPCSFCVALTEEEASVMWADGMNALLDLWARNALRDLWASDDPDLKETP